MKIIILCGGRGKRLGAISDELPKPLVKINGKAILEIKLLEYIRQGFSDFIFCTGYKANLIEEAVKNFDFDCNFTFSNAGETAGMLERVYKAMELINDEVIITYGDTYTNVDLKHFLKNHKKSDNEATIIVAPFKNPFGLVEFSESNKVLKFEEKPILNYYIGYTVINKSAFNLMPRKIINMPDGDGLVTFFKNLIAIGKLGMYFHSGFEITFNTPNELKLAGDKLINFYTDGRINDE
jgi:NDP-sugar pyrophosphorylase family protein